MIHLSSEPKYPED